MIVFKNCTVYCSMPITAGLSALEHPQLSPYPVRVEITPKWIAQNKAKQRAYCEQRKEWLQENGIILDQ